MKTSLGYIGADAFTRQRQGQGQGGGAAAARAWAAATMAAAGAGGGGAAVVENRGAATAAVAGPWRRPLIVTQKHSRSQG